MSEYDQLRSGSGARTDDNTTEKASLERRAEEALRRAAKHAEPGDGSALGTLMEVSEQLLSENRQVRAGDELPTPADVIGSDPDITGGLSTEDYIAQLRGRYEAALEHSAQTESTIASLRQDKAKAVHRADVVGGVAVELQKQRDSARQDLKSAEVRIREIAALYDIPDGGRYLNDWKQHRETERQDLDRISAEREAYREALKVAARTGYATVNLVNRLDTPRLPRAEFRRIVANIKANLQVLQREPEARRTLTENDR